MFFKVLLALLLTASVTGCSGGRAQWLSSADRPAFGRMITDARQARVVFVGEFHDQREHHTLQLDVIKSLQQSGNRLAIGLEMFDMESQPVLDRWVRGEMELRQFMDYYQQNWSISWAEYDSILLYGRDNRIPLIALNAPADLVSKVSRGGFSNLGQADLARLPSGVNGEANPSYREFLRGAFEGHGLDEASFDSFCEAQAVRNNTMGALIGSYLTKNPAMSMVVIAGVGHAMRRAVADDLGKGPGLTTRIIIPVVDGLFDTINRDDADYFVYP
jgi:uncharacterized iron-regulated protein